MRAIIISDADARALLDKLELVRLRNDRPGWSDDSKPPTLDDVYRVFRYAVVLWLQEQGADVVPR